MTRAFTLIEVLVYLALFGILIGGALECAYVLVRTAASGATDTLLAEETDFLLGRMAWEVAQGNALLSPASGTANVLESAAARFEQSGAALIETDGSGSYPLNAPDASVVLLRFERLASPDGVRIVLTLSARTPDGLLRMRTATSTVYLK